MQRLSSRQKRLPAERQLHSYNEDIYSVTEKIYLIVALAPVRGAERAGQYVGARREAEPLGLFAVVFGPVFALAV